MHRPGVFAERVRVPRRSLVPLPDGIDPGARCSPSRSPAASARSRRTADAKFVAVLGCGPLGLLAVYLARARGRARDGRRSAAGAARDRRAARRAPTHRRPSSSRATSTSSSTRPASSRRGARRSTAVRERRHGRDARARQRRGDVPDGACSSAARSRCAASSPTRAPSSRARSRCSPRATSPLDWLSTAPLAEGAEAFANLVDRPAEYAKVVLTPHERPALPRHRRLRLHRRVGRRRARRRRPAGRHLRPLDRAAPAAAAARRRTRSRRSRTSPATSPTSPRSSARSTSTGSRT